MQAVRGKEGQLNKRNYNSSFTLLTPDTSKDRALKAFDERLIFPRQIIPKVSEKQAHQEF